MEIDFHPNSIVPGTRNLSNSSPSMVPAQTQDPNAVQDRVTIRTSTEFIFVQGEDCEECEEEAREEAEAQKVALDEQRTESEESSGSGEATDGGGNPVPGGELTEEEQQIVEELQARDREVRAHEQAHKAAAGPHARGGPTYTYQTGPDGRRYAIGGEVSIDTSEVPNDPQATIQKAQTIRRAALAPAEPSGQDVQVAAKARALETKARQELAAQKREELEESRESDSEEENSVVSTEGSESPGKSESSGTEGSGSGSNTANPQNQRIISQFTGAPATTGNLLDIIS